MKNELILASRAATPNPAKERAAQERLRQVLAELGLDELTARFALHEKQSLTTSPANFIN